MVEIAGSDNLVLVFRIIPEVPAINRSSLTIALTVAPTADHAAPAVVHLALAIDDAKAFLLALRDGDAPIATTDSATGFQLGFAVTPQGPVFTVGKPGQAHGVQQFEVGRERDVPAMAAHLLDALGP